MAEPWILGISASHNGSVCLLHGDQIVVAIQEERLVRQKRFRVYGAQECLAIRYCLEYAGIGPSELAMVVSSVQGHARRPREDVRLNPALQIGLHGIKTHTISHHLGHAWGAFATSGFDQSAIMVIDGMGSAWEDLSLEEQTSVIGSDRGGETISLYQVSDSHPRALEKHLVKDGLWYVEGKTGMPFFGSLGGMFSALAKQIFGESMEAGKVMGLAPFGVPTIPVEDFFSIENGGFKFHSRVPDRFRVTAQWPAERSTYQDLASSAQHALEEAVLYLARRARELSQQENLCYAGGVALNSIANERILREAGFRNVYFMPSAEDSGVAIGAAYYGLWELTGKHVKRALRSDGLGRTYSSQEISHAIDEAPFVRRISSRDVLDEAVERLCAGQICGWFQGGSELGPRALGHRSILCDPRRPDGQSVLNERVKHREPFRPFAPAILVEEAPQWFELDETMEPSPFMMRVCRFLPARRAEVPAVVHVDGTGRLQTVRREDDGPFHELIRRFHVSTGVPILLNTSYNVMGEPIVETPEDALWDILYTGIDFAVLGDSIVCKKSDGPGPLDFFPALSATKATLVFPLNHRPLDLLLSEDARAVFRVITRWGEADQPVPISYLAVLERIDGKTNGRSLLDLLRRADGISSLDEVGLIRVLAQLQRWSVIRLSETAV